MRKDRNYNAIVLAAGMGVRMRPITNNIPKPLIEICNRPLLENILINLEQGGTGRIAVNTHYLGEKINNYVERSRFRDRITIFPEPEILWTGGPIVNARAVLEEHDSFLLHNGDILTDLDLRAMADYHFDRGATVTMLTLDGPENRVMIASDGRIVDINDMAEADHAGCRAMTYGGIFMATGHFFDYLPSEPCSCSSIAAIVELLRREPGEVVAYRAANYYWNDLGSISCYFRAHRDVIERKLCRLPELPPIAGNYLLADGVEAERESLHGFICAGPGCRIAAGS
ncbi:MAG: nucleotidyltransferase family protein, partial [Victivallales bacterium]|nr:nucleotidyltransferase family protein [Victivallales bacterium]